MEVGKQKKGGKRRTRRIEVDTGRKWKAMPRSERGKRKKIWEKEKKKK